MSLNTTGRKIQNNISKGGYDNLTKSEKDTLFDLSKKNQ
jgi:hypothetical protein